MRAKSSVEPKPSLRSRRWAPFVKLCALAGGWVLLGLGAADAVPLPPGVTQSECTPLREMVFTERDFREANAHARRFEGLCYRTLRFADHDRQWLVQVVESNRPGPLWVAPHDDEHAAFRTGLNAVWEYGGVFITLENREQRENNGVDPNRIFGEAGERCWVKDQPPGYPGPLFTDAVLAYLEPGQIVIGLHNNRLKAGAVSMDLSDDEFTFRFRAKRPFRPQGAEFSEPDTMIVMAGATMPQSGAVPPEIAALNALRLNVIYERVTDDRYDCSLSNYFVRHGPRRYFNVEAVDGDYDTQPAIVDAIMRHLADTP